MKNVLILLLLGLFACVQPKKSSLPLFKLAKRDISLKNTNLSYSSVDIDSATINYINTEKPSTLKITLPVGGGIDISLVKDNIFDSGFETVSEEGTVDYINNSLFYTGSVDGEDDSSFVSLNIVNGVISGVISSNKYGELNIGKESEASTSYLIFDPSTSNDTLLFNCSELIAPQELKKSIDFKVSQNVSRCVTMDFELTHEVFKNFGSIQKSNDWLISMFASVKALYKADGVDVTLSKIFNWTTPDGYNVSPSIALGEFTERRKNDTTFKGSVAQLVRGRSGGALSGIAYVDVLCSKNYRFSYSEPMWTYSVYPAYSWSIMVIAHEFGHNIGCPHTHYCKWELSPGVFGAIDACYTTEGGCAAPVPPAGGGTIMSYCHLNRSVGTNMRNGFGPIPKKRLLDRINNGGCTICGAVIDTPPPPPPPPPVPSAELLTRGKPVSQSTIFSTYPVSNVNDGNEGSYNHTKIEQYPWVEIDLGGSYAVSKIRLLSRKDCCRYRMRTARVFLTNTPINSYDTPGHVFEVSNSSGLGDITKDVVATGRYLRVYVKNFSSGDYSHWAEIEAWGKAGTVVCRDSIVKIPYTMYRDSIIKVCK